MHEQSLFAAALEKESPAERAAFLEEACAGDAALRERVEKLLDRHARPDAFFDAPPIMPGSGATVISELPAERAGNIIGPYKLLQKIGEGGFGVVFMAEQERPVRRTVAVKIIKPGMDTAQVVARFESERQALALMDHPNIAKVFDAGATESGRPYFVMELVKGVPITEFCDKNHLPAENRLRLFGDVCRAVQHAHHKGIIHRDVKPSNVMVTLHDGVPVVKVIDFGVAKATMQKLTERTLFTAYGQMVGTPAYMSPEQAELSGLDIDTRSDVYSLGVLLYELLTGTTPLTSERLRQAGYAEMQRLIREETPPRPSARLSTLGDSATIFAGNRGADVRRLLQILAGDLDWIVMKALEKDRNRRYGTPAAFAEDVERYLRREAITARPPSAAYRIKKFAQRHQATVMTAAAVTAALLAGTAIAALQAVRATRAEARAVADRDEKERSREAAYAERRRAEASERNAVAASSQADAARRAAEQSDAESKQRLVRLHITDGVRRMDEGDLFSALPALVEALRLEQGDPERERVHRVRIAAVLRQCPGLVQAWTEGQQVTHAEFSPDGRRVLMVAGNAVIVRDVASGTLLYPPLVHDGHVSVARFSADGDRIGAAVHGRNDERRGEVRLWDALVGTSLGPPLTHPDGVKDVSFHPRGGSLATTCNDKHLRVWTQGADGEFRETAVRPFGVGSALNRVIFDDVFRAQFTPDGARLLVTHYVASSNYAAVGFWDPMTDTFVPDVVYYDSGEQNAHTDISPDGRYFWAERGVRNTGTGERLHPELPLGRNPFVAFSPDSRRFITGDWETGQAQVWEAARGVKIGRPLEHRGTISAVNFAPDAGTVVTASVDGTARVWDAWTGEPASPPLVHGGPVTHAVFAPNDRHLLTVSGDQIVRVWDLATQEPPMRELLVAGFTNFSFDSPSGRRWVAIEGQMASVWDPRLGLRQTPYFSVGGDAVDADFNVDETRLAIGTEEKTATIRDVETGRALTPPLMHEKPVEQTTFIGDGSKLLTVAEYHETGYYLGSHDENGRLLPQFLGAELRLWDSRSGQPLTPVMTVPDWVFDTSVSPDERFLAAVGGDDRGASGTVRLWDVKSGRQLWSRNLSRSANHVQFSPNGRQLLTAELADPDEGAAGANTVTIWDAESGHEVWVFSHASPVTWADFDPATRSLLTTGNDRTVRRWDLERGTPLGTPLVHPDGVEDAAFTADGRFIASAAVWSGARLWDATSGEPVTPWLPQSFRQAAGYWIGDDATWWRSDDLSSEWDISPANHSLEDLVSLADLLTGKRLTPDEGPSSRAAEAFVATWNRLQKAYPRSFQRADADALNWHRRQAIKFARLYPGHRYGEDASRFYAAVWHLDRAMPLSPKPARNWLILRAGMNEQLDRTDAAVADYSAALELAPRDETLLEARASLFVERKEYARAADDLRRAMTILVTEYREAKTQQKDAFRYAAHDVLFDSDLAQDLPRMCLLQNDPIGYRTACEQLLELSRQDKVPAYLGDVAWTCTLAPEGFIEPDRILEMAEAAAKFREADKLRTHGAALFRVGRFDEAAKRLQEALTVQPEYPTVWLFLAMVEQRRGRAADAEVWLHKAADRIEHEQKSQERTWQERVELEAILRETQQTLGTT